MKKVAKQHFLENLHKPLKMSQDSFSCNLPGGNNSYLKKMKELQFLAAVFEKKKCHNLELYITVKYEQSSSNPENFRYSESPLLKLGAVEFAVLFQQLLHG